MNIHRSIFWPALLTGTLSACGVAPIAPSPTHIQADTPRSGTIPAPVNQVLLPPPPRPTPKAEKYTVVVNNVNVQELLISLARDAKVNVDISPDITGRVTLNAIDQSLPQILSRVAKQVDMRYELEGRTILVMRDSPFLRNYKIDYVNMARDMTSQVAISTQIATTGSALATEGSALATEGSGLSALLLTLRGLLGRGNVIRVSCSVSASSCSAT